MKKLVILLLANLLLSLNANAQYKINKIKYNYQTYTHQVGDPYNPAVAGLTSLFVPGLGQMISGEAGRGAAFMGGFVGSILMVVSGVNLSETFTESSPGNLGDAFLVIFLTGIGTIGIITVDIWSVVNGVRVAKVNNLAFRDKKKSLYDFKIKPFINATYYIQTGSMPVGLSLIVQF
jgi:hypothetical protein